jgi:glutathione S-transferase
LLPKQSELRLQTIGIVNELAGEGGFGWCRRLMLFEEMVGSSADQETPPQVKGMLEQYKFSPEAAAEAPLRIADILSMLSARLHAQRESGSMFLIGRAPSAADIYWACFSHMLEPLGDAIAPLSVEMRAAQTPKHPALLAAKDPILLEHRDRMFELFLGPVSY